MQKLGELIASGSPLLKSCERSVAGKEEFLFNHHFEKKTTVHFGAYTKQQSEVVHVQPNFGVKRVKILEKLLKIGAEFDKRVAGPGFCIALGYSASPS